MPNGTYERIKKNLRYPPFKDPMLCQSWSNTIHHRSLTRWRWTLDRIVSWCWIQSTPIFTTIQYKFHHTQTKFCNRIKSFQVEYSSTVLQFETMQQNPIWSGAEYNAGTILQTHGWTHIINIYPNHLHPKTQPFYIKTIFIINPSKPFPILSIPVLYHRLLLTSNIGFCAQQSITGADSQQWASGIT